MIFRFDDISNNTDKKKLQEMIDLVLPFCEQIFLCISPCTHIISDCKENPERVFPSFLKAYNTYKEFFKVDHCCIMNFTNDILDNNKIRFASHGLIHIDHRLLNKQAQELSIITSCWLIKTFLFVPPFSKHDANTIDICKENNIELIRFEDGWKSAEYNQFDKRNTKWYLHSWKWKIEIFKEWLENDLRNTSA